MHDRKVIHKIHNVAHRADFAVDSLRQRALRGKRRPDFSVSGVQDANDVANVVRVGCAVPQCGPQALNNSHEAALLVDIALLDRSDEVHLLHAMSWRFRILVCGDSHSNLGPT